MSATKVVTTRFAPSPTGHLHIGGARTALFNWAFARHHDGKFILRMEDTDRARSTAESTKAIIKDLQWLGIDWDEGPDPKTEDPYECQKGGNGPYFQSQRLRTYHQYVNQLIDAGHAYKCFKSPQELAAEREQARAEKRNVAYDPTLSRSLTTQQIADFEAQGKPCVVRFVMPDDPIEIQDEVLGSVSVQAGQIEDFVILKSDGFPTYHLAVVVDDFEMGITHVIRGQEHLNNAPKHAALQDMLGFERPHYAHIPLIFNPDGSKMSKRDKAKVARAAAREWLKTHDDSLYSLSRRAAVDENELDAFMKKKNDDVRIIEALAAPVTKLNITLPEIDVDDFCRSGYLQEALLNYIALLGWSPGNDIERFDLDFLVKYFSLKRVGKSNARFDRTKLLAFNGETIANLSLQDFTEKLRQHDDNYAHMSKPSDGEHYKYQGPLGNQFQLFAKCYQLRSQTLEDPFKQGRFFVRDHNEIKYDQKAVDKTLHKNNHEGYNILRNLCDPLQQYNGIWTSVELERLIKDHAEKKQLSLGKTAQPLRVAVSGSMVSPPIFDTLVILGKDQTLARIDRLLHLSKPIQDDDDDKMP